MRYCTKTSQIYDKKKKKFLVFVLVLHIYKFKQNRWRQKIYLTVNHTKHMNFLFCITYVSALPPKVGGLNNNDPKLIHSTT